jgi:hypothetical protein
MHKISDAVRSTHGPDGGTILDIRRDQIFNLNFVGSTIVEFLKSGLSELEIVDRVSHDFAISRDIAEADVREFIQVLRQLRLVEECQRQVTGTDRFGVPV